MLVLIMVTAPIVGGAGVATLSSSLSTTGVSSRRRYGYMTGGAGLALDLVSCVVIEYAGRAVAVSVGGVASECNMSLREE